jgi:hypothetical protein
VKTVTIVCRPDGATHKQFVQRLQAEYAPLANKLPGQRGLIISGVVKAQPRDDVKLLQIGPFDAISTPTIQASPTRSGPPRRRRERRLMRQRPTWSGPLGAS